MASNVDAQELARHQHDFKGFVKFLVWMICLIVIVLSGMAIFLL
jgi:hypothetical protein